MKTLDFILPANRTALSAEPETPALPRPAKKPAEPFDSLMHRALARPAREPAVREPAVREPGEKVSPVKKPVQDARPAHVAKAETSTARKPGSANRSEPLASDIPSATAQPDAAAEETTPANDTKDSVQSDPEAKTTTVVADDQTVAATDVTAGQTEPLLQALVASATVAPTTTTTTNAADTGSQNAGKEVSTVAAIGTGPATSAPEMAENSSTPAPKEPAELRKEMPGAKSDPAKKTGSTEGAVPIQVLLGQAEMVKETPANIAVPATDKSHSPIAEPTGTSAAQQVVTMNKAEPERKASRTPEPDMAGVTVVSALQSAASPKPVAKASARIESSESTTTASISTTDRPSAPTDTSSSSSISASSQTELRTRALDRTHDILALHGLRLKESSASSLQVVIKPGAGLQLSLQLQQGADGIQAQAVLQQGDFNQLNQHWAELQQRLEERGIKLAPLGQDSSAMLAGGENFQQPSQQPDRQDALSAGAFAEFATIGAASRGTAPAMAMADTSRGWEGWA